MVTENLPKEVAELMTSGVKLDIHLDILYKLDTDRKKRQGAIFRIIEFLEKLLTGKISPKKVSLMD